MSCHRHKRRAQEQPQTHEEREPGQAQTHEEWAQEQLNSQEEGTGAATVTRGGSGHRSSNRHKRRAQEQPQKHEERAQEQPQSYDEEGTGADSVTKERVQEPPQ
jgi:hypothetical protein